MLATENAGALGVADRFTRLRARRRCPPDLPFDEIWSNPPIRIGKEALHELLLSWLPRLRPGGRAVLVVGKNLGADSLQAWLTDQGYPTERARQRQGLPGPGARRPERDPAGPDSRDHQARIGALSPCNLRECWGRMAP